MRYFSKSGSSTAKKTKKNRRRNGAVKLKLILHKSRHATAELITSSAQNA